MRTSIATTIHDSLFKIATMQVRAHEVVSDAIARNYHRMGVWAKSAYQAQFQGCLQREPPKPKSPNAASFESQPR